MAFILKKLNKLAVKVKGTLPDEDGKQIDFDFTLNCKRLTQEQIDGVLRDKKGNVTGFVINVAEGWSQVLDEAGNAVPFSAEQLTAQLDNPGLSALIMQAYLEQVSAAAKN